ncbi:hypothetical protein [Parasitella parasitica]|uniref:Uncharacterized protein n=1 Tax=Parasitella parasitica TaxID=35722 RepID=A0A0B7NRP7_9FUNG|nr:hypothetical protein [Parasitella parasitica]
MGRAVAATMICEEEKVYEDQYYLEIHLNKDNVDLAIVLNENGQNVFEILATESSITQRMDLRSRRCHHHYWIDCTKMLRYLMQA